MATLAERVAALEALVGELMASRSGKPERSKECRKGFGYDSTTCPKASPYHYQQKCGAAACLAANRKYYGRSPKVADVPVAPPTRRKKVLKRAPSAEG